VLKGSDRPTEEEWEVIQRHPDWGADALTEMAFFPAVVDGVRSHHERWDGSGYPQGLSGSDIPALARVVAITDSYETMTAARPFRPARGAGAARAELASEAGRKYDPLMVRAFLAAIDRLGDQTEALHVGDFAEEWRHACAGLDLERLYLPEETPRHARAEIGPGSPERALSSGG
jgi:HD-GYP domain-containing protein (c-di-GMP phosphodiesterase class II)